MQGLLGQAEELAQQRNAKYGMLRPEPSMMDKVGSFSRRMFWGENDPRKGSLLNQGVLLPDGSRGIPMKGAPKRFESVMDVVGGPLTFAGRMAKTANLGLLKKAQEMMGLGANKDAIWKDTGWFKDVDGHWKFEIDDRGLGVRWGMDSGIDSDSLRHTELNKAYPEFRKIMHKNEFGPERGHFKPGENRESEGLFDLDPEIYTQGENEGINRSVAGHELQHAIQEREGFAKGGSPSMFTDQKQAEYARDLLNWRSEVEKFADKLGVNKFNNSDWYDVAENVVIDEYRKGGALDWVPSLAIRNEARLPMYARGGGLMNMRKDYEDLVGLYGLDKHTSPRSPNQMYKNLAGEAEARNVQTRMDFTPKQRQAQPPWKTLDVPQDELILKGVLSGQ